MVIYIIRFSDYILSKGERQLAKVHTIGKTEIRVYANDHLPPHFHIVNPDFEALIVIEDFSTYAGFLKGLRWKRSHGMGAS